MPRLEPIPMDALKLESRRIIEDGTRNGLYATPVPLQIFAYRTKQLEEVHAARLARGEDPSAVLEAFAKALANKFLHHPTQALSRAPESEREALANAVRILFPEPDEPEEERPAKEA